MSCDKFQISVLITVLDKTNHSATFFSMDLDLPVLLLWQQMFLICSVTIFLVFSSLYRVWFRGHHHHHRELRLPQPEHRNRSSIRLVVVSKSVHHYGSSQAPFCKAICDWGIHLRWCLIGWSMLDYFCGFLIG